MKKESYERLNMDVTKFDVEDVITTSGENIPPFAPTGWELPNQQP